VAAAAIRLYSPGCTFQRGSAARSSDPNSPPDAAPAFFCFVLFCFVLFCFAHVRWSFAIYLCACVCVSGNQARF
jgi:hypothetical protein